MFLTHAVLGKLCSIIKVTRKLFTKGIFFIVCSSKRNRLSFIAFFFWRGGGGGIFLYAVNVALKFRFRYENTMTR